MTKSPTAFQQPGSPLSRPIGRGLTMTGMLAEKESDLKVEIRDRFG